MKKNGSIIVAAFVAIVGLGGASLSAAPGDKPVAKKTDKIFREQVGCIDGWYYGQQALDAKVSEGLKTWDPFAMPCPLDPGKAVQLALKQMKLAFTVPTGMQLSEIVLCSDPDRKGIWYYNIIFNESNATGNNDQEGSWITAMVYLDGTVPMFRKGEKLPSFVKKLK